MELNAKFAYCLYRKTYIGISDRDVTDCFSFRSMSW